MSIRAFLAVLLCLHGLQAAKTFKDLPDWAQPVYEASRQARKPADADDWVLLDRTEFAYTGDGEIAIHRYRLIEVLTDRGIGAGVFTLTGLGGNASKVKKLKGWNLRPDGDLTRLDSDTVVAIERAGDSGGISNERLTGAGLGRVVRGSIIAFESLQVETNPGGPAEITNVMERAPIFRWEIHAATQGGWFRNLKQVSYRIEISHFSPWITSPVVVPDVSIAADNIPPIPQGEGAAPPAWSTFPRVAIRFMDPDLKGVPSLDSWNGIASWTEAVFLEQAPPTWLPIQTSAAGLDALKVIRQWISAHVTYKQIYLSPERSLIPLTASDVIRRRYGDCKDLASCFLAAARSRGFEAFPVLARIPNERIEAGDPVNPASFNHVIIAIALRQTLHLDSEVETQAGRFLLVDPTARLTPLGKLPVNHASGRLMICLKDKGIWVEVPQAVLEQPRLEASLTGTGKPSGELHGNLRIREWANSRNLRSAALEMSPLEFQQFLYSKFLALPANARIQVVHHSDPLDVDHPFEVELSLDDPRGFEIHGSKWDLNPMGIFRMVPPLIEKAGQARLLPVETFDRETVVVQADLTVPIHLTPLLPHRITTSPFHDFRWDAQVLPAEGGGSRLSLRFQDAGKPARFGFETRREGLSTWLKDRREMQDVIADALTFEANPESHR